MVARHFYIFTLCAVTSIVVAMEQDENMQRAYLDKIFGKEVIENVLQLRAEIKQEAIKKDAALEQLGNELIVLDQELKDKELRLMLNKRYDESTKRRKKNAQKEKQSYVYCISQKRRKLDMDNVSESDPKGLKRLKQTVRNP